MAEPHILIAGCKSFNDEALFSDFVFYYTKTFNKFTLVCNAEKPYLEMLKPLSERLNQHLLTMPLDYNALRNGEASRWWFDCKLVSICTHAILFWDGMNDLPLIRICNEELIDLRVVQYRPSIKAPSCCF